VLGKAPTPGWPLHDEAEKPDTYNARRDKLTTMCHKPFGYNHGIVNER
jgi:hypothetical protein